MKIGTTAALLVLCSLTSVAAPARADVDDGRRSADVVRYEMRNRGPALRHHGRRAEHRRTHVRKQEARHVAGARARRAMASVNTGGAVDTVGAAIPGHAMPWGGSRLVSEARRWIGGNPTGRSSLWCARFMNFVLKRSGYAGTSSDMARSFASYGHRLSGPRIGAIAVISRGRGGGHVGVVSGIDRKGNPVIISGNHGHRVAEAVYPKGRVYAYVMP